MSGMNRRSLTIGLLLFVSSCAAQPEDERVFSAESALSSNVPYSINSAPLKMDGNTDVSAVIFNNALFYAFVGTNDQIYIIHDTNLSNVGQDPTIIGLSGDITKRGPSLIVYNNMLHLAYVNLNSTLCIKRSPDGLTWAQQTYPLASIVPGANGAQHFDLTPSLNVWNGTLRAIVQFSGAIVQVVLDSRPGFAVTPTFSSYLGDAMGLPILTNDTPTTATWNNDFYVSWAGTDGSKPINIMHFDSILQRWTNPSSVVGATGRPSLYPTDASLLTVIYRGNDTNIYSVDSINGTAFGSSHRNGATSDHRPSGFMLNSSGDHIWAAYSGRDQKLYTYPMLP